jgi:hypothetical protein
MDHHLVAGIEKARGWAEPASLGTAFTRGALDVPGLAERLLTPHGFLDIVMRRSLSTPQFRCFVEGSELHPNRYFRDSVTRRGQAIRMVDMERIGELLNAGCTAILDQAELFDPTLEIACRALQWRIRELVQVNAYLTTGDADGFDLHWDDHDVVVVQVSGEKHWEVRGPSRTAPMYRDTDPNREPSDEILWSGELEQGGVLHIPRGYWHRATRAGMGDGHSLHLTFGIVKRTGVTWLSWLADWSRESTTFRRDLDRWSGAAWNEQQDALTRALADLSRRRTPQDFLTAREAERRPARRVPALRTFGPPTTVVCITEFPPVVRSSGRDIEVIAAGKKLTFDGDARHVLTEMLSGRPVVIEQCAARTSVDAARVAQILIEEDLCTELSPALSSGYTGLVTGG